MAIERTRGRYTWVPLALLFLSFAAAGLGQWLFAQRRLKEGLFAYVAALLIFLALQIVHRQPAIALLRWNKWFTILALGLLLASTFVRFYKITEIPPGCWIDEAINGLDALELIRTGKHQLYLTTMSAGRPPGFVEILSISFRILPDAGIWLVRATAGVIGSLGVLFFFFLAKAAFSGELALIATAFLAFSHWHINYSRWGVEQILSPTFGMLTLWLLFSGLKSGKKWVFLLAGVAFGLGIYSYFNYRLFVIAVLAFVGYLVLFHWRTFKRQWLGLAIFLAAAFLVALPEIYYALTHPQFFDRANQTVVWSGATGQPQVIYARLSNSIRRTLLGFQFEGDYNGRHNLPGTPLLTFVPAMLLPLGLVLSLARLRKPECAILPLWFFFGVLPGAITWEAPHASRVLDSMGAVYILASLPMVQAWAILAERWPRWGARAAVAAISIALGFTLVQNLRITFILKPADQRVYEAFLPMEALSGYRVQEVGETRDILLSDKLFTSPVVRFIARKSFRSPNHVIRQLNPVEDVPLKYKPQRDVSYIMEQEFAPFLPALRYVYPNGQEVGHRDPFGKVQFYEYRVSREEAIALAEQAARGEFRFPFGLQGSFYANASGEGEPALKRIFPYLRTDFDYLARSVVGFQLAVWKGTITIPESGFWIFVLNPSNTSLTLGDRLLIADMGDAAHEGPHEGGLFLEAREYPIEIRYVPRRDARFAHDREIPRFIWLRWVPPGKPMEWVPSDKLRYLPSERTIAELPKPQKPSLGQAAYKDLDLVLLASWGEQGSGRGQFLEPRDVAVGDNGRVYVADTGNRRVQVLDSEGRFLAEWKGGDKPFVEPLALVVNSKGEVLVLDSEPNWIYRFSADGKFLGKFAGPEAHLYHPRGMAIDSRDIVYVMDTGGARYVLFDVEGNLISSYGTRGSGPGQFSEPTDLAVSSDGTIYVADMGNERIQRLVSGQYSNEWPIHRASSYSGVHLALADDGSLFATAPELSVIQRFAGDGTLLGQWGEGFLRLPVNLALSGERLYVADTLNHRVLVYQIRERP